MSEWSFEEVPSRRRGALLIQAALYTPLAVLFLTGVGYALFQIATGETGYIVLLTVSGILSILTGFQSLHYLLDLGSSPTTTEGEVSKKWTKGNLLFFFLPSYYIAVKGKIFSIRRMEYAHLLEQDLVRLRHYPNTLTIEVIERFDSVAKKFIPADGTGDYA